MGWDVFLKVTFTFKPLSTYITNMNRFRWILNKKNNKLSMNTQHHIYLILIFIVHICPLQKNIISYLMMKFFMSMYLRKANSSVSAFVTGKWFLTFVSSFMFSQRSLICEHFSAAITGISLEWGKKCILIFDQLPLILNIKRKYLISTLKIFLPWQKATNTQMSSNVCSVQEQKLVQKTVDIDNLCCLLFIYISCVATLILGK